MLKSIISLHSENKNPIYISVTEKERELKKREKRVRKEERTRDNLFNAFNLYF